MQSRDCAAANVILKDDCNTWVHVQLRGSEYGATRKQHTKSRDEKGKEADGELDKTRRHNTQGPTLFKAQSEMSDPTAPCQASGLK